MKSSTTYNLGLVPNDGNPMPQDWERGAALRGSISETLPRSAANQIAERG